jgi:hypothetical protein
VIELLTIEDFTSWLQSRQPDELVGVPRDCNRCPLATFLHETTGKEGVYVSLVEVYAWDTASIPTPEWAQALIHTVDTTDESVNAQYILDWLTDYTTEQKCMDSDLDMIIQQELGE